jgi:hypothetical protein
MTDPIILIAVTFRDFNGSDNDRIQRLFIDTLRRQTYSNWRLVVGLFNEKRVEEEIRKEGVPAVFHRNGPVSGYKFSLTDVLLNAVEESGAEEHSIILWTTCDVLFPPDFLATVVRHATPGFVAVSHPHLMYASLDDLAVARQIPASLNSGMDLVIMDGALFRNERNLRIIRDFRFRDWGIFEHFLVGFAQVAATRRINLFGVANIGNVENDRVVGAETQNWLLACWNTNNVVIDRFIADYRRSPELLKLIYCHMQFQHLTSSVAHYRMFAADYAGYYADRVKRRVLRTIPAGVKRAVRRIA